MEGATEKGNQSTGTQLPSEEKSQGKKVSADPLGEELPASSGVVVLWMSCLGDK